MAELLARRTTGVESSRNRATAGGENGHVPQKVSAVDGNKYVVRRTDRGYAAGQGSGLTILESADLLWALQGGIAGSPTATINQGRALGANSDLRAFQVDELLFVQGAEDGVARAHVDRLTTYAVLAGQTDVQIGNFRDDAVLMVFGSGNRCNGIDLRPNMIYRQTPNGTEILNPEEQVEVLRQYTAFRRERDAQRVIQESSRPQRYKVEQVNIQDGIHITETTVDTKEPHATRLTYSFGTKAHPEAETFSVDIAADSKKPLIKRNLFSRGFSVQSEEQLQNLDVRERTTVNARDVRSIQEARVVGRSKLEAERIGNGFAFERSRLHAEQVDGVWIYSGSRGEIVGKGKTANVFGADSYLQAYQITDVAVVQGEERHKAKIDLGESGKFLNLLGNTEVTMRFVRKGAIMLVEGTGNRWNRQSIGPGIYRYTGLQWEVINDEVESAKVRRAFIRAQNAHDGEGSAQQSPINATAAIEELRSRRVEQILEPLPAREPWWRRRRGEHEDIIDISGTLRRVTISADGSVANVIRNEYSRRGIRPDEIVVAAATLIGRLQTAEYRALSDWQRLKGGEHVMLTSDALRVLHELRERGDDQIRGQISEFVHGLVMTSVEGKISPERAEIGRRIFATIQERVKNNQKQRV